MEVVRFTFGGEGTMQELLLPPIMLAAVAFTLWLSLGAYAVVVFADSETMCPILK
jgi:hypothetical protein